MISIKKQSGTLYEIPILFFGYAVICVIFLRPELHKHLFLLVIPVVAGIGVVAFFSSMSEFTYRVLKISIGTWCFVVATTLSWPLIILLSLESSGSDHVVGSTSILLAQALICYLIDRSFIAVRYRKWLSEKDENNEPSSNNEEE
jgi:hypothetical protein